MSSPLLKRRHVSPSLASIAALFLWLLSLLLLFVHAPSVALLALSGGFYALLLGGLTLWLLPQSLPAESDDVLRATSTGIRRLLQGCVVTATIVWTAAYGIAFGGWDSHVRVPLLTRLLDVLSRIHIAPHLDGFVVHNFLSLALIPGVILLVLGMRPRELGLCAPVRGTGRATLACLVVPLGFVVWAFARKGLTVTTLGYWLVHNLLSNGFSEEFFARGMLLSHLRARLTTNWALVLQALVFALLHAAAEIPARRQSLLSILAEVIALNFPMGLALGIMAVRSRSLLMPTIVHTSLDTMKDLLSIS